MNSRVIEGASATDNASRQATQLLERTGSAAEGTWQVVAAGGSEASRPSLALCH